MLTVALLEVGSIASLIPFLQKILLLNNEGSIIFFDNFFNESSFYKKNRFLLITSFFIGFILLSLVMRMLLLKMTYKFVRIMGHYFSEKVISKVLNLSYIDFTKESSSKFVTLLETKIDRMVDTIYHALDVLSSLIILTFIFTTLSIVNAKITLIIFSFFLICYLIMFRRFKQKMIIMGDLYAKGLSNRVKVTQEIFGSFRLLKIDQKNSKIYYNNNFLKYDFNIRSSLQNLGFLSHFPRYLIEGIAVISVSFSAYFLIRYEIYENETIILSLGVVGFAAQRLLPLIQRIYFSSSWVLSQKETVHDCVEFLYSKIFKENYKKNNNFKFEKKITFENVSFTYKSKKQNQIFNNINLEIKKNLRVCILGETGSGKSTFVDLIVGLLKPDRGKIKVDDYNIEDVMSAWHDQIAYVPQNTFLIDATILENVAFGVETKNIDINRVNESIEIAGLKSLVEGFPDKLSTKIGERGILLSGGQIQRLGLARAFYKNFELLILDESTNALDSKMEELIYSNIKNKFCNKTIIVITHKPELSKNSDIIIKIEKGKIEINN